MAEVEVVDLCNEDDEVRVEKTAPKRLRRRAEPKSPPPAKRASLPRKCKSTTTLTSCPPKAQTNSTSTAQGTQKRTVKERPRKKAVLSSVKESESPLIQPCQIQSASSSLPSIQTASSGDTTVHETGKEQEKQPSIMELDFIPLSGDVGGSNSDYEEHKKTSKVITLDEAPLTLSENKAERLRDSEEASCSNSLEVNSRNGGYGNEQNAEKAAEKDSNVRALKRKLRGNFKEVEILNLSSIPLPGDPINMSTPKPSLRQFIKANRRRRSTKKRDSVVLLNRGLPLNEEIVIDEDDPEKEDEVVPVSAPSSLHQESLPNPDVVRLSPSVIYSAGNKEKANASGPISKSGEADLFISDEQKRNESLEEGEIEDEVGDEIQFICNKASSSSGNVTSRSSSPDVLELPPAESAKKKAKNKKKKSLLEKRENLEYISILHDSSQNKAANGKGKKKRKKGKAAEISTQTTPSLARLAAGNNNGQPVGSSPTFKPPIRLPNSSQDRNLNPHVWNDNVLAQFRNQNATRQGTRWIQHLPFPCNLPNLPFVPTVHSVPQAFNFGQLGNPQQQKPGLMGPIPTLHNPDRGNLPQVGLRPIVIDGCNVAMHHGKNLVFSVRGIQLCVDYFLKLGHRAFAFVPEHYYGRKPDDPDLLMRLERSGHVIKTPGRIVRGRIVTSYDDKFIVSYASEVGGIVVSRDRYRDLLEERRDWRVTIEKRLLQPTFVGNMVMFPDDPLGRYGPRLSHFLSF